MKRVRIGLERLLEDGDGLAALRGRRAGLITNHTGVDPRLTASAERLAARSDLELRALFGMEHGYYGNLQDALPAEGFVDPATGLPVYSLFGETRRPTPEMLRGLDILLFDAQDAGARFYTYATTMVYAMEAAAEAGLDFMVLDRPNPIGGKTVEGSPLSPAFRSFLGYVPVPVRHGLTLGELAVLADRSIGLGGRLHVIRMEGWNRDARYDATGLPWVMPSPNLPTIESVTVYPGTCLVEGTNLSEGRGTTRPFEIIGAPWVDGRRLAAALADCALPACLFRPLVFQPTFWKHAGQPCGGIQIHVTDPASFMPFKTGVLLLDTVKRLWPREFAWTRTIESPAPSPWLIDLLAGTDELRLALDAGVDPRELLLGWEREAARFAADRPLLY